MATRKQAVFGITGRSGSGKTTLIEAVLPLLRARGLRVNVIKHSHHRLTLEPPGKDSARVRAAGASEVMVASPTTTPSSTRCRTCRSPRWMRCWRA